MGVEPTLDPEAGRATVLETVQTLSLSAPPPITAGMTDRWDDAAASGRGRDWIFDDALKPETTRLVEIATRRAHRAAAGW
jgi:uncharacterized protein YqjF (DUF2071 family)